MEFSRQEYWSGLPFPISQNLPNPGIEPVFPASSVLAGRLFCHQHHLGNHQNKHLFLILESCLLLFFGFRGGGGSREISTATKSEIISLRSPEHTQKLRANKLDLRTLNDV